MTRALALLTAAALGLTGCNPPATTEVEVHEVRIDPNDAIEGPTPAGRFYVVAGEHGNQADLWAITFGALSSAERLTTHGRVSQVAGCPDSVVVSAAQKEVGYVDTLQRLDGKRLVPIDGFGADITSSPDVSADCQILFSSPTSRTGTEIKRHDPHSGRTTTVVTGEAVAGADWGPDGEILVLERRPAPFLVVRRPDGTTTEIEGGVPDLGNSSWGKGGWIAGEVFSGEDPSTATLFVNPATGERDTLEGWLPLDWSPAGDQLLVTDALDGSHLGVVDVADLTRVRSMGHTKAGPVWDAVWLPA